ncbi:hypothetical protein MUP01_10085 [Candidatus Bathyarchaeota archaeon]|nr:hypothetical protein [Candidatus Bathyarchaeota archaeon]
MLNLKELAKIKKKEKIAKLSMVVGHLWNRELYVSEIARRLGSSNVLTSKYLSLLKKANIIRIERIEKARGQPRKYYRVNIEAIIKHFKEKYGLQPIEERILVEACERAIKAINASPNPMDRMRAEKIRPDLILTYPFIMTFILAALYGMEPDVNDLERIGVQSSEINSLQRLHYDIIEWFQPSLELSAEERSWFKNEENKRVLMQVQMKILNFEKKDKFMFEILSGIRKFIDLY